MDDFESVGRCLPSRHCSAGKQTRRSQTANAAKIAADVGGGFPAAGRRVDVQDCGLCAGIRIKPGHGWDVHPGCSKDCKERKGQEQQETRRWRALPCIRARPLPRPARHTDAVGTGRARVRAVDSCGEGLLQGPWATWDDSLESKL